LTTSYLKVGAAFHCEINEPYVERIVQEARRLQVSISPHDLKFPVYGTHRGINLANVETDIIPMLVKMQAVESIIFRNSLQINPERVTHIFDFGPGDGTAKLCNSILRDNPGTRSSKLKVVATAGKSQWNSKCDEILGFSSFT